uniref:ABC-type multidrug transport system ATPase n=1 Tax=Rathayibacter sp. FH 236 TaxID=2615183 RepID=A0A5J6SFZ5_9MICO|nr:ABC-type multidrug transport system ATPase [Rathayibacter sp. FH 236]
MISDPLVVISPVFEVIELVKTYPGSSTPAVDIPHLVVPQGEVFGLLGENGAGKSSFVKMLVGLLSPDSGLVRYLGSPIQRGSVAPGSTIAYMPQSGFALNTLTVSEALMLAGRFRGLSRTERRAEHERVVNRLELGPWLHRVATRLSGGQRRLLQLGVTMIGRLPVVVLDEPTNDLDPGRRRMVWDLVGEIRAEGTTVVLITHNPIEAEQVLDTVAIMKDGCVIARGTPKGLKARLAERVHVDLHLAPDASFLLPAYATVERRSGRLVSLSIEKSKLSIFLDEIEIDRFDHFKVQSPTLEDVYRDYIA